MLDFFPASKMFPRPPYQNELFSGAPVSGQNWKDKNAGFLSRFQKWFLDHPY